MTTAEARAHFNAAIARTEDPDKIANLEILREYLTNPKFKHWLHETVWNLTKDRA